MLDMISELICIFSGLFCICLRLKEGCIFNWWNLSSCFAKEGKTRSIVRISLGKYWILSCINWKKMCIAKKVLMHTGLCCLTWSRVLRNKIIMRRSLLILSNFGSKNTPKITSIRLQKPRSNSCIRGFWKFWSEEASHHPHISPSIAPFSSSMTLKNLPVRKFWTQRTSCSDWFSRTTFLLPLPVESSSTCFSICQYPWCKRRKGALLSSNFPHNSTESDTQVWWTDRVGWMPLRLFEDGARRDTATSRNT